MSQPSVSTCKPSLLWLVPHCWYGPCWQIFRWNLNAFNSVPGQAVRQITLIDYSAKHIWALEEKGIALWASFCIHDWHIWHRLHTSFTSTSSPAPAFNIFDTDFDVSGPKSLRKTDGQLQWDHTNCSTKWVCMVQWHTWWTSMMK